MSEAPTDTATPAPDASPPTGEALLAEIQALASLDPAMFELERAQHAARLGFKPTDLGRAVSRAREGLRRTMRQPPALAEPFEDVQPWDEPVEGPALFDEMHTMIKRFAVCDGPYAVIATLWCGMTWFMDRFDVAPFAMITATTMGCGKSVMLELMSKLSYRPFVTSSATEAVLFRLIETYKPSVFIDESDRVISPQRQELLGTLNASYTRASAYAWRCEGDDNVPRRFGTWSAKAYAGIGALEATLGSRAVPVVMRRKLPGEKTENLRKPNAARDARFAMLCRKLARFAADVDPEAFEREPELPPGLENRGEELWQTLCTVAEAVGGAWPQRARDAAIYALRHQVKEPTRDEELLADVQTQFMESGAPFLTTEQLLKGLCQNLEARWATYHRGNPLTHRDLAKMLKGYGGAPKQRNIGGNNLRGYYRADLEDAFARYLRPEPVNTLGLNP